jgi:polysaccharide export outer membrane protein
MRSARFRRDPTHAVRALGCLVLLGAALTAAGTAHAQRAASDYVISGFDVLSVYVWNHPEISTDVSVSANGVISYPLIGDVTVGGLAVRDAEERIRQALTKYYVDPKVTVTLKGLVNKRISVTGEVAKPGDYDYVDGFTLTQYLASAGGAKDAANVKQTRITRLGSTGAKVITIDLRQITGRGRRDLDLVLQPGDNVSIPKKWFYSFRDYSTVAQIALSAVTVYTLLEIRSRDRKTSN